MRGRAERWVKEAYPFGSEMPWDSTGQEEVYAWAKYFGYKDKADITLNAILGYDPAIPHWGYNGSARRYWDFIFGASHQYRRIERQLHHYGSGLNAIPVLSSITTILTISSPRSGYAGNTGVSPTSIRRDFSRLRFIRFPTCCVPIPFPVIMGPTSSAKPGTPPHMLSIIRNSDGSHSVETSGPTATC
jgi:hypothetical protein